MVAERFYISDIEGSPRPAKHGLPGPSTCPAAVWVEDHTLCQSIKLLGGYFLG